MIVAAEKKFVVDIVYNGVTKPFQMQPEERVTALLSQAIASFGIAQNQHLFSLFREDGTAVPENASAEQAGLKPNEVLLLRPNAVKGGEGEPLHLAADIVSVTFREFRACGRGQCECAVYWTGSTHENAVDGVDHPLHARSRFGYEVASNWLTQFWKHLRESKRSIKAQVHTHPGRAFHSDVDNQWPIISQAGFLSIVIPDFATGEATLDGAWLGRLREDGTWQQVTPIEAVSSR